MAVNTARFVAAAANAGFSNAPRIHTYKSVDAHGTIDAPGYFNAVRDKLEIGDLIYHAQVTNLGASNEALADASFFTVVTVPAPGSDVTVSTETAVVVAAGT